jgi:SAM-dependent methyltransferase
VPGAAWARAASAHLPGAASTGSASSGSAPVGSVPAAAVGGHRFYSELARWWPLVSPVEDYAGEAREFLRVLQGAGTAITTVLELGSGGGHNAFHLKRDFRLTLSDLSEDMLEVSRRLNPECEHARGDMRTIDLGRTFDAVFIHDAIDYMTTEADLGAAIATAFRHCRPGGVALFVPDVLAESFEPGSDCGGTDGKDGEGIRFLEWSYDPDPDDTVGTTHYTFLTRERDGTVRSFSETHLFGIHPRATWLTLLEQHGFEPEVIIEETDEDREPRTMFLVRRPPGSMAASDA